MTDATSAYLSQADLVEFLGRRSTEQAAEIERLQADNRRWSKVADERSKENCALRQENERLRALTTRLRTAAESVCWFDWSNNDRDAVEAITELRLALEQASKDRRREFAQLLKRIDAEQPEATFTNAEDMLAWLNDDPRV